MHPRGTAPRKPSRPKHIYPTLHYPPKAVTMGSLVRVAVIQEQLVLAAIDTPETLGTCYLPAVDAALNSLPRVRLHGNFAICVSVCERWQGYVHISIYSVLA